MIIKKMGSRQSDIDEVASLLDLDLLEEKKFFPALPLDRQHCKTGNLC